MKNNQIIAGAIYLLLFFSVSYYSCVKDAGSLPGPQNVSACDSIYSKYSDVILPMMQANCAISGCHDASGGAPGNLSVYAEVKTIADNGKLRDRVLTQKDMPPSGPLPDSLLQKLDCWISKGAQNN